MAEHFAQPGDIRLREYAYSTHVAFAKTGEGEDLDTIRRPGFWVHCVRSIKVRDVVQVIADDGSFEWHGRVTSKGNAEIYFRELFRWERPADVVEAEAPAAQYIVEYGGPHHKHRVKSPDGSILKHGFDDRASAQEYLRRFQAGELRDAA